MKNFSKENRFGRDRGNRKFGNKNFGGRGSRSQMHDAICSKCGKQCQVPFRPTGEKPIFCSDCFGKERGGFSERAAPNDNRDREFGNTRFEEKRMYSAVCSECGNKCEVPFLPTGGKRVYCSNCFGKGTTIDRKHTEFPEDRKNAPSHKEQFDALHKKLDAILQTLSAMKPSEKVYSPETTEKPTLKKVKKVVKKAISSKKKK